MSVSRHSLAHTVAISAFAVLSACVSDPASDLAPSNAAGIQSARPVVLDEKEADSVQIIDVINRSRSSVTRTGEVYLMRGLANVFSRGIDEMAVELRKRGYDAANFSYSQWQGIADDIVRRSQSNDVSYPVIIVGHSLGGNESSKFANYLTERGVNIALVVAFDPVETGFVGQGIETVVNYYLPKQANNIIMAKEGFTGEISNIDVTTDPKMTHTNVDKEPRFQQATYTSIANLTRKLRPVAVDNRRPDR